MLSLARRNGRQVAQKTATGPYRELGITGLRRWGGQVEEEFLPQLRGRRAIRTYREMAHNDPVIAAILFAIRMIIRQVEWNVQPFSSDRRDAAAAEFLHGCLDDMSTGWGDILNDVLSFLVYGWSFMEIVYKRRQGDRRDPSKRSRFNDGRVGWRKLAIRAQETLYRWEFDEGGGIQAMVQMAPPDYQVRTIPIEKALLFRTDTSRGNPEGLSILRGAYRSFYFKKTLEEIEGIGIERDLAGLPVVWVPPEVAQATDGDAAATKQAFLSLVKNIRRDRQEGVVMPLEYDEGGRKVYDIQLLSTGGRRQFDTSAVIERYSRQIAMSVLADFILLGHEKVGSFALSESKTNLFVMALRGWLDSIRDVFNRHAIPRLWRMNGWDTDRLPQFTYGELEVPDLQALAAYINALAGVGALVPDENLEVYLRELAGLPTVQQTEKAALDGGCDTPARYP